MNVCIYYVQSLNANLVFVSISSKKFVLSDVCLILTYHSLKLLHTCTYVCILW